jgi:DNA-binding transcriptional ArsR family regulator
MPRAATTTDVFNAIAEPRRRQIIELLARRGALAVGALVVALGIPQPAVSKHLGVLRKVGVVTVIKQGKQRVYSLEAEKLKTVYDWAKAFAILSLPQPSAFTTLLAEAAPARRVLVRRRASSTS